jgi:hypothetical protein
MSLDTQGISHTDSSVTEITLMSTRSVGCRRSKAYSLLTIFSCKLVQFLAVIHKYLVV